MPRTPPDTGTAEVINHHHPIPWQHSPKDELPTIHQLIPMVLREVGVIGKDHTNPQHNYRFRSIDDIADRLQPALIHVGIHMASSRILFTETDTYTTKHGTLMRWAKVGMHYDLVGPAGDMTGIEGVGEAADASDKAHMKAMQQAWKYALVQGLAIPTRELDADAQSPTIEVRDPTKWAKVQVFELAGHNKKVAVEVWAAACAGVDVDPDSSELTADEAAAVVQAAQSMQQAPFQKSENPPPVANQKEANTPREEG